MYTVQYYIFYIFASFIKKEDDLIMSYVSFSLMSAGRGPHFSFTVVSLTILTPSSYPNLGKVKLKINFVKGKKLIFRKFP
jgi:hypothetical protein